MNISLSALKENPERYFELAKTDKQRAIEALIDSVEFPPEYNDPQFDPDYERLRSRKDCEA